MKTDQQQEIRQLKKKINNIEKKTKSKSPSRSPNLSQKNNVNKQQIQHEQKQEQITSPQKKDNQEQLQQTQNEVKIIEFSNKNTQTNFAENMISIGVNCEDDQLEQKVIQLQQLSDLLTKEKVQLSLDKKGLLLEKLNFSEQLGNWEDKYQEIEEKLSNRNQKYTKLKDEYLRVKSEQENKGEAYERLQEEIELMKKQKVEYEGRAKKFEQQWKGSMKEVESQQDIIDELNDKIKQLQNQQPTMQRGGSVNSLNSSFNIISGGVIQQSIIQQQYQQLELRLLEVEKERDMLNSKVNYLERSIKELIQYKKQVENALSEIKNEDSQDKQLELLNLNLIRKKSLTRLEVSSTNKEEYKIGTDNNKSYLGQRASASYQYQPGFKRNELSPPHHYNGEELFQSQDSVLLQSQQLNDGQSQNISPSSQQRLQFSQHSQSHQQQEIDNNSSATQNIVNTLFGSQNSSSTNRFDALLQLKLEMENEDEKDNKVNNKQKNDQNVIQEDANESNEYDEEENSSSSSESEY